MAGLNNTPVESPDPMMGHLVDGMHTDPNDGTTDDNMLNGKNEYTDGNNLPIDSQIEYGMPIQNVIDTLNSGGDVEILISWDGGGGHAAMVIEVIQHADGSFTISYIDDPVQGDGQPGNQIHTIHVDANGNFPGGTVDGFLVENWN